MFIVWIVEQSYRKKMNQSSNYSLSINRPESLATTVARTIEEAIARGEFPPGSSIVESRLCDQINVSRGTLREALRLLQDRGLVEMIPHQGAIVSTLNSRKAREIYTLRMVLESYAVRLAMERKAYTQEALDEIHKALERLFELADQGNPALLIEGDMEFHRLLCCHCDHDMLLSMLDGLQLQTRRFVLFTKLYQTDLQTEAETHKPIWEALLTGDSGIAEKAVENHIREAGELLVEKMIALESQNGT